MTGGKTWVPGEDVAGAVTGDIESAEGGNPGFGLGLIWGGRVDYGFLFAKDGRLIGYYVHTFVPML